MQADDLPSSSVYLGYQKTVTSAYTLTSSVHFILVDATIEAYTITLLTSIGYTGVYNIEAITTTTNLVIIDTLLSQTIESFSSGNLTLGTHLSGAPYSSIMLMSDSAHWRIV